MSERIERVVTSGTFSLDGGCWDVDNNVWIIGNDSSVIIIDPAHDVDKISRTVAGRTVEKILLTHAHDDHIRSAKEAAERFGAPVYLNPADEFLWRETHPHEAFRPVADGDEFTVAGVTLRAVATPGHTPGATCFVTDGVVFTGDTLFEGGPGATRWEYSDFDRIIASIRERLFTLPDDTVVNTGHGPSTTIGKERPHLDEWITRGW